MERDKLGDSYDVLKRFWRQVLDDWAPLFAVKRFIPDELQGDYTRLTGIPILTDQHPEKYSILNDPDTGISVPGQTNQDERLTHISIQRIANQLTELSPRCIITFDQSFVRKKGSTRCQQICEKLRLFQEIPVFYYVSHAPFLFAFPTEKDLEEMKKRLVCAGIPEYRLRTNCHH